MSGKPFTIKRVGIVQPHLVTNSAVLSLAELSQPSCPSCYRPLLSAATGVSYCRSCVDSGAAGRHADHPDRQATL